MPDTNPPPLEGGHAPEPIGCGVIGIEGGPIGFEGGLIGIDGGLTGIGFGGGTIARPVGGGTGTGTGTGMGLSGPQYPVELHAH